MRSWSFCTIYIYFYYFGFYLYLGGVKWSCNFGGLHPHLNKKQNPSICIFLDSAKIALSNNYSILMIRWSVEKCADLILIRPLFHVFWMEKRWRNHVTSNDCISGLSKVNPIDMHILELTKIALSFWYLNDEFLIVFKIVWNHYQAAARLFLSRLSPNIFDDVKRQRSRSCSEQLRQRSPRPLWRLW